MRLHRSAAFLRAYRFLPHRLLNRALGHLVRARRPAPLVQAAIDAWVRRDRIDLADFQPGRFATVEEFFLRRLRPGARPIGAGVVAPADGIVVEEGVAAPAAELLVKGRPISIARLVNGASGSPRHALPLDAYRGGRYLVVFLTPRGYHYVHLPEGGELVDCRFLPGRFFPQNEDALRHIDAVYERNERAVVRLRLDGGGGAEALLVMVGASLIGGIHLAGVPRLRWVRPEPTPLGLARAKGDELGWFSFGSTVVLLLPRALALRPCVRAGDEVRMGRTVYLPA